MPQIPHLFALILLAQGSSDHASNPVFRELVEKGFTASGATVRLPAPSLPDGQDAEKSRAVLKAIAGDDRASKELLRDSVTAPFILKTKDEKAGGSILRSADLWFVVRARLEDVDPAQVIRQANDQVVEVANMKVESRLLAEGDLEERKLDPLPPLEGRSEWSTHLKARLLDRIEVDVTDQAIATRSADSLVVAARTDRRFDADPKFPNRWAAITRRGNTEEKGPAQPSDGGASYVKVTKIASEPGALLVEAHFVYSEPEGWFQGNPILRSKFGVIAQDQIRRLRREIEKKRAPK